MKTLLFIAAGLLASTVMAASFADLTISGVVAPYDNIEINPTADATLLNIVNGELTPKLVANPVETSNRRAGYVISLHSQNAGDLVHTTPGFSASRTSYTVSYNDSAFVSLDTDRTFAGQPSLTELTTKNSTVKVMVAPLPSAVEGTYQDVITISIVAN